MEVLVQEGISFIRRLFMSPPASPPPLPKHNEETVSAESGEMGASTVAHKPSMSTRLNQVSLQVPVNEVETLPPMSPSQLYAILLIVCQEASTCKL